MHILGVGIAGTVDDYRVGESYRDRHGTTRR